MYNETTEYVNTEINICNGTIFFDGIDEISQVIAIDVTTPWNTGSYIGMFENECYAYFELDIYQHVIHAYFIKVTNIDFNNKKATFNVLSYADEHSYDLDITDTLPTKVRPGDTVNFNYNIKNTTNDSVTVRHIMAASSIYYPRRIVSDYEDCDEVMPPTTMNDIYEHCWYNDWISPPAQCNSKTLSAGSSYDISGSFIVPSDIQSDYIYISLYAFIYKENYWTTGKNEWVWSRENSYNIVIEKSHLECIDNECKRVEGAGTNTCTTEGSLSECSHLECIDNVCTRVEGAGTDECTTEGVECGIIETHTIYYEVSKILPSWYVYSVLGTVKEIAQGLFENYTDYDVDINFDSETYILKIIITKKPEALALFTSENYDIHTLVPLIPIAAYILWVAYSFLVACAWILIGKYLYSESVTDEKPLTRNVTVRPWICTTNVDTEEVECEKPTMKVIVEYCIAGGDKYIDCKSIEILDGNPVSFQIPTNIITAVTVKTVSPNYTIYKEMILSGIPDYIVEAKMSPKADAKVTPVATDTDNKPIPCGYYAVYEEASDGSMVEASRGDLDADGKGPTLTTKAEVLTCQVIVPCDLTLYKYELTCVTPEAGEDKTVTTVLKKCNETKNAISVRTTYITNEGITTGFIADKIEIKTGLSVFKTIIPTTDITFIDELVKNTTYTIHIVKSGYTIINNDQTIKFTTDCFTTSDINIKAEAPIDTYDITIKVKSSTTGYVIQGATVILDSLPSKKTDVTGSVIFAAIPTGSHKLKIKAVGYGDKEYNISVTKSETFIKELTPDTPTGTIDTRINNFKYNGDMTIESIVNFEGILEFKENDSWKRLMNADINITIRDKDKKDLKIFNVKTKDGLLDSGYFETPEWLIPKEIVKSNIIVTASFAGIGNYKPSVTTEEYFIKDTCCISLPGIGCIMSQQTCKNLKWAGIGLGAIIVGYTVYKMIPQRKLISEWKKST